MASSNHFDEPPVFYKKNNIASEGEHLRSTNHILNEPISDDIYDDCYSDSHPLMSEESERSLVTDDDNSESKQYTVEEAIEHIGFGRFQLKVIGICGLFSATDALEMLLLSVLSPELRCQWQLEDWQVAVITMVVFVGMFVGSNMWGSFSDTYGRLPIMKLAAFWILYFGILTSQSPSYLWLIILRGLVGFGFGGAVQSFTLLCEYLPSKYRAKILIIYNFMWSSGCMFEIIMAYLIIPRYGWRILVIVSAAPSLLTLFAIWTLPESARYLLAANRRHEAIKVLRGIAKMNRSHLPPGELVECPETPRGRFRDLFSRQYARTTIQLLLIWFGVACVYYGVILAQSEILEMGGVCGERQSRQEGCKCQSHVWSDYLSMIIATLGEYIVIPINLLTVDTLGRKWSIGINFLLAGICYLLVQICTSTTLLTVFIFGVRTFITGVFNLIYIYTGEVFPTTVRSFGLGSCSAMARIGCMLTPFVAQVLLGYSLYLAIWFYGSLCFACVLASFLLPIETKGRAMPQSHVTYQPSGRT